MPGAQLEGVHRQKNEQFHRRLQRCRNIASGVVALALIAALGGAFGSGPLNRVTQGNGSSLSAEFPRMLRLLAPSDLTLYVSATDSQDSTEVSFNENYIHAFDVISITPRPSETRSSGGRIVYQFRPVAGKPMTVMFRMKPVITGALTAEVARQPGALLRIRQLVLP
jgi:hypothetical protein